MKKRIVSIVLACLMVLPLATSQVSAASPSGKCGNNVTWSLDQSTGVLTISGTGDMYNYQVADTDWNPYEYDLSTYTYSTNAPWWNYRNQIKSVIIEDGVTSIGDNAFSGSDPYLMPIIGDKYQYSKLSSVSFSNSVKKIGKWAFWGCAHLKSIRLLEGLESIDAGAFAYCTGLKEVAFPNSLKKIGDSAFSITAMMSATIPHSVTSIGVWALGYNVEGEADPYPIKGFTIYGFPGTVAEQYYKEILEDYNRSNDFYKDEPWAGDNWGPSGTIYFVPLKSVSGFYDVLETDWFADDVKYVSQKNLMTGTGNNLLSPNGKTTRGQAVTILYRLAGSPSVSGDGFSDVKSSDWFYKAVQWASKNGITSGYGNGKFGPNDTLNREQLATMLYRYAQFKTMNTTTTGGLSKFSDGGSVSGYALDAMSWAVSNGLISGTSDGKLTPGATATRAQLAAILHRFCENLK